MLSSFSACANEYPLPFFSGEWYIEKSNYFESKKNFVEINYNACSIREYSYLFKSYTSDQLVRNLIGKLPTEDNCVWKVTNNYESEYAPQTYPTDDWHKLDNQIKSIEYTLGCQNNNNEILRYDYITVSPIYLCPEGSRVGYDGERGEHCLEQAPLCQADLVGRDLATEWKWPRGLGHVGIASWDGNVIEVLNKPSDIITFTPINEFANIPNTEFWGAKHGYHKIDELSDIDSTKITDAGIYQMAFNPVYTYLAEYVEGAMVPKTFYDFFKKEKNRHVVAQQAAFRCDTFVQYSYLKGANIRIWELVPHFMFNAFKHDRKPLPFPDYILSNYLTSFGETEEQDCDSDTCFRERIKNLIDTSASLELIFYGIDEYKKFLQDKDKFDQYLHELYIQNKNNRELSQALLVGLAMRNPSVSVVRNILDEYYSNGLRNAEKINIVNHFSSLFVYDDNKEFNQSEIDNINMANEILIDILKTSYDVDLVSAAANAAESMMNKQHSDALITEALMRLSNSSRLRSRLDKNKLLYEIFNNNITGPITTVLNLEAQNQLLLILNFSSTGHLSDRTRQQLLNFLYKIKPANNLSTSSQLQYSKAIKDRALWLNVIGKIAGKSVLKNELDKIDKENRIKIMRLVSYQPI